jgi:alkanesulfonate monooxygenase SsuD/methylene tetrahydromethanopterin reductase-like flavin-dependent oxidoreductase (luciferase family)
VKVGLTLPSFRDDPEPALEVARAAERAGLDGVFAFDHVFRIAGDGSQRPALEMATLLGAVAVETDAIAFGPLAARATLRPAATLAVVLDTLQRIGGGRLVATLGSGDSQSEPENEAFGLDGGDERSRLDALERAVTASRGRGFPVWVGGRSYALRVLAAARADGWNRWGSTPERLAREARTVREHLESAPRSFTVSWGGLVVLGENDEAAERKRARLDPPPGVIVGGPERVADALRQSGGAGASWGIVGPVDSSAPENAAVLGERVMPLLEE